MENFYHMCYLVTQRSATVTAHGVFLVSEEAEITTWVAPWFNGGPISRGFEANFEIHTDNYLHCVREVTGAET